LKFKKVFLLFIILFLFFRSLMLIVTDIFLTDFIDLTLSKYFFWYLNTRLPLQLPLLVFVTMSTRKCWWQKLFSYKIWLFPSAAIIAGSVFFWCLSGDPYTAMTIGFSWSWVAIITHSLLFILQLFLYQRFRSNLEAFILSFLGCKLGGFIYELPVFPLLNYPFQTYLYLPLMIAFITFGYLILYRKPKFCKTAIILSVLVLASLYLFYFQIPWWMHRLFVFPLFLSLAHSELSIAPLRM